MKALIRRPHIVRLQVRLYSKHRKEFDYQAFEEEIRSQRQRVKHEHKPFNEQHEEGAHQSPSKIVLPPQVSRDLQLLNVPKYVSREDLKKQYHKLAKIYHPDIQHSKQSILTDKQKLRLEERFKEFKIAYERLLKWVEERDQTLNDDLKNDRRPGVRVNEDGSTVTYTFGKLQIEGKRSTLDKQQILLEMVEEDLNLKEPVNMRRYLWMLWGSIGMWVFYKEFRQYYKKMSQPREEVKYEQYFRFRISQ